MFSLMAFMATISCLTGGNSTLSVSQYPREITASVGMTAIIACKVQYLNKIPLQMDVYWYKDEPTAQNALTIPPQDRQLNICGSQPSYCCILVLSNLTLDDSGVYICEVSIPLPPPLMSQIGNGTRLIVQESKQRAALETHIETRQLIIILVLSIYSVAVTIVVVALAILMCSRVRPKDTTTAEASSWPGEPPLNSFREYTGSTGREQTRQAPFQEYEDMALFRNVNQKQKTTDG